MRKFRTTAHGAALLALALFLGACGSGVGGDDDDGGGGNGDAGGGGGGQPVASQLVLGGPPECPERPFCIPGLEETYGIEFKEFKPLDVAGPLTIRALEGGEIDVALLFSTQSVIADRSWVLLEDDKGLQTAENITPVINHSVHDATVEGLLNQISGALTTENVTELNGRVEIDGEKPADVAADFLESEGISGEGESGSGNITVGAVAFAENQIVAEMYAQVLEQAGYSVKRQLDLGSREILEPALESGEIHVAPEYLGSLLLFLDPDAAASGDPQENHDLLVPLLDAKGIGILEYSEANDTNAFVVTQETADEYGLQSVSDLAAGT
jgi:glycine betaine/choline ABC-type transport system substrate-binding protein